MNYNLWCQSETEDNIRGSNDEKAVGDAAEKVHRRGKHEAKQRMCGSYQFLEAVAPGRRCRQHGRGKLTVGDKIRIAHQVIVEHHSHHEVAKEHRISTFVVYSVVKKAKQNPKFLDELLSG